MRLRECSREKEVLDLLKSGHWPEVCDPDLRAHVKSCSTCSDTVLLKSAFQNALGQSRGTAQLDSPSLIWWRAQLRRRNAAVERVSKPVAGANRFALIIYLLAALGLVASQVRLAGGWMAWISGLGELKIFHPNTLWSVAAVMQDWDLSLLIPCVGAIALLSGVVIYLAAEKS
jgi:hypothetical protein